MELNKSNSYYFDRKKLLDTMKFAKLTNKKLATEIAQLENKGSDTALIHRYQVYLGRMKGRNRGVTFIDGAFIDLIEKVLKVSSIKGKFAASEEKYSYKKDNTEVKELQILQNSNLVKYNSENIRRLAVIVEESFPNGVDIISIENLLNVISRD